MIPRRLNTKQRQKLYDCEVEKAIDAGRGPHPICNICDLQIFPGSRWHDSHNPYLPRALGGARDGIAHERCNLRRAWRHDIPLIAKIKRIEQKRRDIFRTSQPMQGGRDDRLMKKCNGTVINRKTGERAS